MDRRIASSSRPLTAGWLPALLIAFALPLAAQDSDVAANLITPLDRSDPAVALVAAMQLEAALLQDDLARYESAVSRRIQNHARIDQFQQAIDDGLLSDEGGPPESLRRLLIQLDRAIGSRAASVAEERRLAESILERRLRVQVLQAQIDQLFAEEGEEVGPLTGSWDVVMLPLEQRGRFELRQEGTLVRGTYRLAGGWNGSLQGTLVNRKVYLIRIDSRLGKSMEYEGFLSVDGKTIRGSWQSYELADGEGANGQWSASKK